MRRITILAATIGLAVALWVGIGLTVANPVVGVPVLAATLAALYLGARWDNRRNQPRPVAPPQWKVYDEELPPELSATEREMANRTVTGLRWPEQWRNGNQQARRDADEIVRDVTGPEHGGGL